MFKLSGIPKLDRRDAKLLLEEVEKLASQYTPEWNFDDRSSDFGVVLAKIFCYLFEGTINKYNQTSYNYYLTFLNMMGIKMRPASSSSGIVIVKVEDGSGGTYIDKGSALFAKSSLDKSKIIIYETLDNIFAVDTKISGIYFTDGKSDMIANIYTMKDKSDPDEKVPHFKIYDNVSYENMQSHEIYFYDDVIFNMTKPDIIFKFYNTISEKKEISVKTLFSDKNNVLWEYFNGSEWEKAEKVEQTDEGVRVVLSGKPNRVKVLDKNVRCIKCKIKNIPEKYVSVTGIVYKSFPQTVDPDYLFCNDTHLKKSDFFPFEEKYTMYNNFFISCEEAFTKKGARIEIEAEVQFVKVKVEVDPNLMKRNFKYVMTDIAFADLEPSDMIIEEVVWEYWNGLGWSHLKVEDGGQDFFTLTNNKDANKKVSFICPDDIKTTMVGSGEGYFIRARISKLENQFGTLSNYVSPYIHKIGINYEYKDEGHICKDVVVKSNMDENKIDVVNNGEVKIFQKVLCEHPAMYIKLTKPLSEGTIRLFINIQEGIHRYNPAVKWEYCADNHMGGHKWNHIEVMDLTEDFSHSETITMIGKNDFKKIHLFGSEGYFIRIINPDDRYLIDKDLESRPVINDIQFNAIKIAQRETHAPEFFSITHNEENKVCKLTNSNAMDIAVWVNEIGRITLNEKEIFLNSPSDFVSTEYDELGNLKKLWIKWAPVPSLICMGMLDRVYEVDYSRGEIKFGNGKNGKIPPDQSSESIKIEYSICNGIEGNVDAGAIGGFISNVDNIMSVTNPSPIMGGVSMETIDSAALRMFSTVSGGDRLVSMSDFEESICFNDRNIYKVKCLSHIDEDSKPCVGVTSIAVLPVDYMQGYEKFQGIKNRVWDFVDSKAPITLSKSSKIRVFEVAYVETCVGVDIVVTDFNSYQSVYKEIKLRLEEFLNPVSGNFSRKGWEIGEFPRKEFIYNYIKVVKNIRWIRKINIFTRMITLEGKKEVDIETVRENKFVVPVYGEPEINISVN